MKRLTCILLALCLLIPMFGSVSFAEESENLSTEATNDRQYTLDDLAAGFITPYEYFGELDPSTVPEIIGYETALSRFHVQRMYEEEDDLNTVVFMNTDLSRTKYYFGHPVKYIDENGETQDISLDIVSDAQNSGDFITEANSVTSTFSSTLSEGISLSNEQVNIELIPLLNRVNAGTAAYTLQNNAQAQMIDSKTVSYYYDDKTTIEYSLTYTGFKEDIVVSEYTGQTEYVFTLYTNGLYLECIDGSYFLVDNNDNIKATLGDIIIFTADERNNTMGNMTSVTVREGQEYLLTIHVDAEYLADENTVYPIRIDPTVEITDADSAGTIEDVLIRQNYTYNGNFTSTYIGRHTDGSLSRLLMRFPNLSLDGINSTLITSATVELRDLICSGVEDMTIECRIYNMSSPDWSESSGATWTSVGSSYVGTLLDSHLVSFGKGNVSTDRHRYSFNITDAAKMWANGTQSPQKGLVFKADSTFENQTGTDIKYWYKTFASYNRADYKPSFTLTYTTSDSSQVLADDTYYLNNTSSGKYLRHFNSNATGVSGLISSYGSSIQFVIEKADVGYVIKSKSDPTYLLTGVESMPYVSFAQPTSATIPNTAKWNITYSAVGGVLIQNVANNAYLYYSASGIQVTSLPSSDSESYKLFCWRAAKTSSYGDTSAYTYREMVYSTKINDFEATLLKPKSVPITKTYSNELWVTSSDFTYSYSASHITFSSNYSIITASQCIPVSITATHKVTNRTFTFTVDVLPLLIYSTANQEGVDISEDNAGNVTGHDIPEDYRNLMLSSTEMSGIISSFESKYSSKTASELRDEWEDLFKFWITNSSMQTVSLDMIEHFMTGNGTAYSNQTLTNTVEAHSNTRDYTDEVEERLASILNDYSGDILDIECDMTNRKNSPFTVKLGNPLVGLPVYGDNCVFNGLAFCIHGYQGVRIYVTEYTIDDSGAYSGTLQYTFFDHFGLDRNDISNYDNAGFESWYILQHHEKFSGSYKPFVTYIEFEHEFSGTIS